MQQTDAHLLCTDFQTVLETERKAIAALRTAETSSQALIGLAFSGGGIRSATLNLGILQGLAKHGLLDRFDYLSTVSGGGYIGGWFSSLIKHNGGTQKVMQELQQSTSPNPRQTLTLHAIDWLRNYSNYLTPKAGLFTADTLSAIAQWLTNTLLNQLLLLVLLTSVMMGVWMLSHSTDSGQLLVLSAQDWSLLPAAFVAHIQHSGLALTGALLALTSMGTALFLSLTEDRRHFHASCPILAFLLGVAGVTLFLWTLTPVTALAFAPAQSVVSPASGFQPNLLIGLGVPIASMLISLGLILSMGVLGRHLQPHTREWWHRIGGINLGFILIWLVLFTVALYLPHYLSLKLENAGIAGLLTWLTAFLTSRLGKSQLSSSNGGLISMQTLAKLLPYLAITLILLIAGFLGYRLALSAHPHAYLAGLLTLTLVGSMRFDINVFSLHHFYRNRLTRAYLGASNPNRKANPFTGFDENDDIKLAALAQQRPLHLINTALNISDGSQLAWQQRQATAFMFSPYYCGFVLPGKQSWYPTAAYTGQGGPHLGSLIATSGAAASPNMGYHTNPVMGFIMTIFNARLGRWFGNPLHQNKGNRCLSALGLPAIFKNPAQRKSPFWNLFYLVKELITNTGTASGYLYLSDGGHFENLGIYELVRRQCRLIIVIDAGADGDYQLEDLGNAIRKCKMDFNLTIKMDIGALLPAKDCSYGSFKCSQRHYAIGTIDYTGDPADQGYLLYIKSSLTGNEPADLVNFKLQEPEFPHHSTIDQFFSESQFESYRRLGEHLADDTLHGLQQDSHSSDPHSQPLAAAVQSLLWPKRE